LKYNIDEILKFLEMHNNKIDRILIENFVSSLNKLSGFLDGNLSSLLMKSGNGFRIPGELGDEFREFVVSLTAISKIVDNIDFFDVFEKDDDKVFWDAIKKVAEGIKQPFTDTEFLRSMSIEEYSKLLNTVFYVKIAHRSFNENIETVNEEFTNIVVKVFHYALDEIIDNRINKENFLEKSIERFGFARDKSEIIWNLIDNEWHDMLNYVVLRRINEYKEEISAIKENVLDIRELMFAPDPDDET
jgi:hypothetical protein